jgi:hypothetical protein
MNFDILQSYAMSNTDIFKIIGKSTVIKYPDLASKKSIFECFDSRNRCVLFFETVSNGVGHWEAIFYIPSTKTIHFFDSYGLKQDDAEKFINSKTAVTLRENKPYLTNLINIAINQGYKYEYNSHDYQSWKGDVETCGKHVCNRLLNMNIDNEEYFNYMNQMKSKLNVENYDNVVEEIIYKILGK